MLIKKKLFFLRLFIQKIVSMFTKKNVLILSIIFAVGGRILLNRLPLLSSLPNIDPTITFAVLTALFLGPEAGMIVGATSCLLSNMLLGQGGWTIYMMIAGAIAGGIAGYGKKEVISSENLVAFTVLGTIIYQMIVSLICCGKLFDIVFSGLHIMGSIIISYFIFLIFKNHEKGIQVK